MAEYHLTQLAADDITAIADYTFERFGIDQALKYQDRLFRTFDLIAENPMLGTNQSHTWPNTRRFASGYHQIFYKADVSGILILRILGPGQNPSLHIE